MADANLVLIIGAGIAGAVVIDYGIRSLKPAFSSTATASTSTATADDSTSTAAADAGQPSLAGIPTEPGPVANSVIPETTWNPLRKPIADWIVPILQWASENGWTGSVTSGYRTYAQQAAINASGAFSATAGTSNHETTTYPGGAVDVTDPAQLISVLGNYTGVDKLIGGVLGAVDPEHFSATGH